MLKPTLSTSLAPAPAPASTPTPTPTPTRTPTRTPASAPAATLAQFLILPLLLALPACAPPSALGPTLEVQRDALARAAGAVDADYRLLLTHARANLEARERLLLGAAHRELIEHGHLTPALEPDSAAFDADLSDPAKSTALINEVRLGRVSRESAHAFLHDYALAMRMRREGTPLRDRMLSELRPLADARHDKARITEAVDLRRRSVLALLDEAAQGNRSLTDYAERASWQDDPRFAPESPDALWRQLLAAPNNITNTTTPPTPPQPQR